MRSRSCVWRDNVYKDKGCKGDLSKRQQQLEQQLEDEEERAGQLEERKIYVKTKKYVEEVAKSLGLVYPDELIYRPDKN